MVSAILLLVVRRMLQVDPFVGDSVGIDGHRTSVDETETGAGSFDGGRIPFAGIRSDRLRHRRLLGPAHRLLHQSDL